ncbi:MAG: dehydrogenase (quinone) [Firmicutes bacterium]|nr:dehydrogenase (quinone) [Bacillota bacterium]
MEELIYAALALPLLVGALSMIIAENSAIKVLNISGSLLTGGILLCITGKVVVSGVFASSFMYVDALSALLLLVVAFLSITATLFSASYMDNELARGRVKLSALKRYYALLQLFIFTMIGVLVVENLGLMWVGVETTTLASTLLVAFYFNRSALEAAWKYVMVCNVGILFALLGTIMLYYTQVGVAGTETAALSWTALRAISTQLDPMLVKLAFVFILIGYGTKAGIAPMHTWLPDAYSQAPAPVSGLLSGALLSCVLYVLIRNLVIIQAALTTSFVNYALLAFGIFSVAIAIPFILIQHDIKRLLAYSSVEHVGIVTFGLGIGTHLAAYGVVLHILNHAVVKSVLFYLVGIIGQQYGSKQLSRIRGMFAVLPGIGAMFILAMLAIVGTPPLSIFMSKFTIVLAAFEAGWPVLGSLLLLLLAGVFAGMMFYSTRMVFGTAPRRFVRTSIGKSAIMAVSCSMLWIIITGVYLPPWLQQLLEQAALLVARRG